MHIIIIIINIIMSKQLIGILFCLFFFFFLTVLHIYLKSQIKVTQPSPSPHSMEAIHSSSYNLSSVKKKQKNKNTKLLAIYNSHLGRLCKPTTGEIWLSF